MRLFFNSPDAISPWPTPVRVSSGAGGFKLRFPRLTRHFSSSLLLRPPLLSPQFGHIPSLNSPPPLLLSPAFFTYLTHCCLSSPSLLLALVGSSSCWPPLLPGGSSLARVCCCLRPQCSACLLPGVRPSALLFIVAAHLRSTPRCAPSSSQRTGRLVPQLVAALLDLPLLIPARLLSFLFDGLAAVRVCSGLPWLLLFGLFSLASRLNRELVYCCLLLL